ncbi:hypothetical protein Hanom_Chr00s104515g01805241 [Helianthus anomalus]
MLFQQNSLEGLMQAMLMKRHSEMIAFGIKGMMYNEGCKFIQGDAIKELAGKNDRNYVQVAVLPYYQVDAYVCTATRPGIGFWRPFSFPMKFRSSFLLRRGFFPGEHRHGGFD